MVGIVASRIVERFHRPTILIGVHDGMGKGSARSIEGFHLYDAIKSVSGHADALRRAQGRGGAVDRSHDAGRVHPAFETVAGERLDDAALVPRCRIDAVVSPKELDEKAVEALQRLAPFGMGNPEPVLALRNQVTTPRVLQNKTPGEPGHLKLTLESAPAFDVIGFRQGDRAALTEGPIDLAFKISVDEYRGVRRLSLKLTSLRASPA